MEYKFNPFTGNFDDVGLSNPVEFIDFKTDATPDHAEGRMHWDDDSGGLEVDLKGGNVKLQVGQEFVIRVKADENIADGDVVYVTGADGTNVTIAKAQANAASNFRAIGMATEAISSGQLGYINTAGIVRGLDTSSFSDGDTLYLSGTTAGAVQNTLPDSDTYYIVVVGHVQRDNNGEGEIYINMVHFPDKSHIYKANEAWVDRALVNGTFRESFNCLLTSNGTTVTATLTNAVSGDLTCQFSSGNTVITMPYATSGTSTPDGIDDGTDSVPKSNYVYILQSDTSKLQVSTTGWPATEHIKVSYFLVPSATYVQSDGVYINQNWNDHLVGTDNMGHLAHIAERSRRDGAYYFSGVGPDGDGGTYLYDAGGGVYHFKATAGVIFQMHKHNYAAKDTVTDDIHVVNQHADNGGPYDDINDLASIIDDAQSATLNNKYYNLVFWGVANKGGEYAPVMCNLPNGSYNNLADAQGDVDGYDVLTMPREFNLESSTGFLICRMTLRQSSGTWVHHSTVDLRGQTPATATGGASGTTTEFSDNQFKIFDADQVDRIIDFDAGSITAANTRTITMADVDVDLGLMINKDGTTPLTANWDVGNFDLTAKGLNLSEDIIMTGSRNIITDTKITLVAASNSLNWDGSDLYPQASTQKDLGGSSYLWRDLHLSRNITDGTNTLTVAHAKTAYDHSQLSSGNPHSVTPTELSLVIGTDVLAQQTIGIADNNLVEVDDADAADNDYAKFTANGLEGREYSEVRSDLNVEDGADVTDTANVTSAGALMDSECTSLADVKALDQSVVSGATPTFGNIKGETKQWQISVIDPATVYGLTPQVFIGWALADLTITKIQVEIDTTDDINADLKWADDFQALTGATVIDIIDTTSGKKTITSGFDDATIAAGKAIYLQFDATPSSTPKQYHLRIDWDFD
jgi:hypothetical protein